MMSLAALVVARLTLRLLGDSMGRPRPNDWELLLLMRFGYLSIDSVHVHYPPCVLGACSERSGLGRSMVGAVIEF